MKGWCRGGVLSTIPNKKRFVSNSQVNSPTYTSNMIRNRIDPNAEINKLIASLHQQFLINYLLVCFTRHELNRSVRRPVAV